jgi:hypothetical protein
LPNFTIIKNLTALLRNTILVFCLITCLISCKEDAPVVPDTTQPENKLNIQFKFGSQTLSQGANYQTADGRKISFSIINFYLSNISLKADTGYVHLNDLFLLCNANRSTYELTDLPIQNYSSIRFSIGVDSVINAGDPTDYKSTDPLGLQSDIPMHWGWNTGYVFALLEGKYDETPDNTGIPTGNWAYHIGLNQLFMQDIEIPLSDSKIEIVFDAAGIFNNVDVLTEIETMSTTNFPLASKISENLKNHVFKKAF